MPRITGAVEVLVNGNLQLNKEGAVASGVGLSGEPNFELEEIVGDTGLHGYVERPVIAMLEVTLTDRDDVSLSDLAAIRENGTVIFRGRLGGKSYTMEQATCMRNMTVTAGDGEVPIVFKGPSWDETVQ